MNEKLKKIYDDASEIADEALQRAYVKKEVRKIEDELTDSDFDEFYTLAEKELKLLQEGLKELKKE
jgi:hypothetical protein